jgi:hypothetical protein
MKTLNVQPKYYAILALVFFFVGIFYYAFVSNILIFNSPFHHEKSHQYQATITKKKALLYFWYNDKWQNEEIEILCSTDIAQTLQHLINSWLSLIAEETEQEKQVTLQSVALSDYDEAFISFDRNPFDKNSAAIDKLYWVEGLLKTIKENDIKIQTIQFLVHHKALTDYHLDFSNPWPIEGFISS